MHCSASDNRKFCCVCPNAHASASRSPLLCPPPRKQNGDYRTRGRAEICPCRAGVAARPVTARAKSLSARPSARILLAQELGVPASYIPHNSRSHAAPLNETPLVRRSRRRRGLRSLPRPTGTATMPAVLRSRPRRRILASVSTRPARGHDSPRMPYRRWLHDCS